MIASLPVELIARALEFVAPRDQCRSRRVCHLFKAAVVEVAYGYVERIIDAWNPLVNSEGPVAAQPIGLLLPVNVGETMVFEGGSVEAARFFKCVRPPPPIHCGALLHRALAGRRVALWPDDCLDGLGNVLRTWIGELQRRDRMSRSQLYGRKATELSAAAPQPVATLLPLPTCTPGQLNDELRATIDTLRSMMTVMIVDQDLFSMNANPLSLLCSQLCGPGLSSTGSETAADWWSRDEQRLAVLPLNYIARHVNNAIELPPSVLLTHTSRGDVRANLAALLRTTVTPFRNVTFEFMDAAYCHAFQEMLRRPPWTGHVDLRRCDFSWVSFGEQSSIRSLQLPTSCHAAWGDAMVECKDLRVVDLSAVTSVGSYAFAACHALQRVRFSPLLIGIGRDAFTGIAIRRLDLSHCTKLECLEANAFSGCPFLADVCLPASITKLDDMCMSHLPSLTSVDFGGELSQLTTISIRVFERCTALVQLGFPPRLETVGPICDGCTALKVLDFSRCVRLSRVAPQIVDHRARVLLRTDASVPVLRAFRRHNILLEVPL